MIRKIWKDCRFQADEHSAVLENDVLRTEWSICRSSLALRFDAQRSYAFFRWTSPRG